MDEISHKYIDLQGENLIFVISQPRAGSTLLQRILGTHPEVHTISEPWLMLNPLYALREQGINADYDPCNTRTYALRNFLESVSNNKEPVAVYYQGVRHMGNYLYEQALAHTGKRYFLDKTPRYYHIIPELYRTFPRAKYIILIRNPLAVLLSTLRTWSEGNWFGLSNTGLRHDLLTAPDLLIQGIRVLGNACIVVRYEELIMSPERIVRQITDFLGLNFTSSMIEYGAHNLSRWDLGDQHNVYAHEKPIAENAQAWINHIQGPQTWRLLNDYLITLGRELIKEMGYSFEECHEILKRQKPKMQMRLTLSLTFLLKPDAERTYVERIFIHLLNRTKLLAKS